MFISLQWKLTAACARVSQQSKTSHAMALCMKVGAPFNSFGAIKTLAKMEAAHLRLGCAMLLLKCYQLFSGFKVNRLNRYG